MLQQRGGSYRGRRAGAQEDASRCAPRGEPGGDRGGVARAAKGAGGERGASRGGTWTPLTPKRCGGRSGTANPSELRKEAGREPRHFEAE